LALKGKEQSQLLLISLQPAFYDFLWPSITRPNTMLPYVDRTEALEKAKERPLCLLT
jgi:hypothetical protein